ncbi:hypothetical protein E2C01_035221 [Portunus trituberculatus]|uniref:Uncharacterized protein n=1 Tax=Portunus trituberculatus TaxID=210409 RepID=A0A5B7F8S2_PORTR|nr:hypothetical protein [Portunus trituberculatus]
MNQLISAVQGCGGRPFSDARLCWSAPTALPPYLPASPVPRSYHGESVFSILSGGRSRGGAALHLSTPSGTLTSFSTSTSSPTLPSHSRSPSSFSKIIPRYPSLLTPLQKCNFTVLHHSILGKSLRSVQEFTPTALHSTPTLCSRQDRYAAQEDRMKLTTSAFAQPSRAQ